MVTWKAAPIGKVLDHLEKEIAKGHRYGEGYNLSQTHGRIWDMQQSGLTDFPVPIEDGKIDYNALDQLSKGEDDHDDGREHIRTPECDHLADRICKNRRNRGRPR